VNKMKKDNLDKLISEVLEEEINDIDITDEEIEIQWMKLQEKSKNIKAPRKNNLRKIAAVIGVLAGITMLNLPNSETSAWKVPNIIDIIKPKEGVTSINQSLSIGEGIQIVDEDVDTTFKINSTEEIRDIVTFNFKELPYDLDEGVVRGSLDGGEIVYLNYISDKGKIELIQMRQGLEFTQSINIGKDSNVSEIKINDTLYSIVQIPEEHTKVIWASFGVHHTMDIYYPIEIEEIRELIKVME